MHQGTEQKFLASNSTSGMMSAKSFVAVKDSRSGVPFGVAEQSSRIANSRGKECLSERTAGIRHKEAHPLETEDTLRDLLDKRTHS